MPLFMDVHPGLGDVTPEEVAEAHRRDLAVQDEFGVRFLSYWIAESPEKAFCLAEAPDKSNLVACHKRAHGLMPHNVIEVQPGVLSSFLGSTGTTDDRVTVDGVPDSALRAIMFTDLQGSTEVSTRLGDDAAMRLVRRHNDVARSAVGDAHGREVKHTGDGMLVSFISVVSAVQAAVEIQRATAGGDGDLAIKIGMSVGEPVEESDDIYGAAVNLAARICAHAAGGQILVSSTVRDLAIGKGFDFVPQGFVAFKGFPDPIGVFEVGW